MAVQQLSKRDNTQDNMFWAGREVITQIMYFVFGAAVSKGALMGSLAPFGASFVAAVPFRYMFASLIGSSLGYILLTPTDSFRYIVAVVAIGAIRWVLGDVKRLANSKLFAPLVAFLPVFATSVMMLFVSTTELSEFTLCVIESVMAGGAAYFIAQSVELFSTNRTLTSFNQQELASIVMAGCIIILSMSTITVDKISLGRIIAVVVILLCGRYGGVGVGSISGIATGVMFSLSSSGLSFLCGGYAFGGLMAGLFSPTGKIGSAIAFALCSTIMSLASGDTTLVLSIFIECIIGTTIFMIIPKSVGNTLSSIFLPSVASQRQNALKNSVVMRLDFASKALNNVSGCVTGVSEKLKKMYSPTMDWVYTNASNKTCSRCGLKVYCWEKQKETTKDDFSRLSETLQNNGSVSENTIESLFVKKCCKQKELAQEINNSYKEYLACNEAQRRVTQVRSVVAGQFSGLSEILRDLAIEFDNYETYDVDSSQRVTAVLKEHGFAPIDCSCRVDCNNRMVVEIETANNYRGNIKKGQLLKDVSKACGRRFDSPCISYASDRIRMAFNELAMYDVQIGTCQHTCTGGNLCGDSLNYFNNGFGSTIAIISDGMGTGGRAAVDGNMATSIMSKLCKAGLSYDCALQVVNSSLMVKSEEESLATLDMISIDLYSGKVNLMKAGAPLTFIKKNSQIIKKEMPSLPLGILNDVRFSKDQISLTEDDIIVMVSDGAMLQEDKWLEDLIRSWNEGSVNDLATAVVNESIKRRNDGHDDDITAIAMRIVLNE